MDNYNWFYKFRDERLVEVVEVLDSVIQDVGF